MRSRVAFLLLFLSSTAVETSTLQFRGEVLYHSVQNPAVKVDVDLTLVNVTVTDPDGHYIPDLTADNFRTWEDKTEQKIEYFSPKTFPSVSV